VSDTFWVLVALEDVLNIIVKFKPVFVLDEAMDFALKVQLAVTIEKLINLFFRINLWLKQF